jgi:hypothetical protein
MNIDRRGAIRLLITCLVASVIAIVVICLLFRTSIVLVENQSNVHISDVRIAINGQAFWSGTLAPGETHREFGLVKSDDKGVLTISFSARGERRERSFPSGFLSLGNRHQLKIQSTLDVEHLWVH